MAQIRNEPDLGRSMFTPQPSRQMPTARRTGNLFPVGYGRVENASTPAQDRPRYTALTAKMIPQSAHQDHAATPSYSGKGKGPATSPVINRPNVATTPSAEEHGDSKPAAPILTSDVLPNSQALAKEAERRYQEEVDRLESQRDRQDGTFAAPEEDSQTQDDFEESPRTRAKRTVARESTADAPPAAQRSPIQQPPVQRPHVQQPPARQEQQPQQVHHQEQPLPRKRKADDENPLKNPRQSPGATVPPSTRPRVIIPKRKTRRQVSERHNNKRFELLKPESQVRRRFAVQDIKNYWSITDDQLMTLPFAPRHTTEQDQPIMKPLNWNSKLLAAVAQLAMNTRDNFAIACAFAEQAFMAFGRAIGANQLTADILLKAIAAQHATSNKGRQAAQAVSDSASPREPASEILQNAVGSTSPRQPANDDCHSVSGSTLPQQPASRPSLIVRLPMAAQTPQQPASPALAQPSPLAFPMKSEQVVPILQREIPTPDDSESSGTEERLNLESERKILKYRLAIVQEQIALDDRTKKAKERRAARAKQLGTSADEPVVV